MLLSFVVCRCPTWQQPSVLQQLLSRHCHRLARKVFVYNSQKLFLDLVCTFADCVNCPINHFQTGWQLTDVFKTLAQQCLNFLLWRFKKEALDLSINMYLLPYCIGINGRINQTQYHNLLQSPMLLSDPISQRWKISSCCNWYPSFGSAFNLRDAVWSNCRNIKFVDDENTQWLYCDCTVVGLCYSWEMPFGRRMFLCWSAEAMAFLDTCV